MKTFKEAHQAACDKAREEREKIYPVITVENRKEAETFEQLRTNYHLRKGSPVRTSRAYARTRTEELAALEARNVEIDDDDV